MKVSSKRSLQLVCAGGTHAGSSNRPNQDSIRIVVPESQTSEEQGTLLIVADGLGGYDNGDVASAMVCEDLPRLYYSNSDGDCAANLRAAVMKTNRILHKISSAARGFSGMCTTLVAAAVVDDTLTMVHVGDSKGFLFRNGAVAYATTAHCIRIATFESEDRRFLTQSMGSRSEVSPTEEQIQLEAGDIIVLCTDGLWEVLSPEDMLAVCTANEPGKAVAHLIDAADARGSTDDVSVVVAVVTND